MRNAEIKKINSHVNTWEFFGKNRRFFKPSTIKKVKRIWGKTVRRFLKKELGERINTGAK